MKRVEYDGEGKQRWSDETRNHRIAVFSEVFGPPDHREFCGVLSEAKWTTAPLIEACGFHPSVLEQVHPVSFLHEIVSMGEVVYQHADAERITV